MFQSYTSLETAAVPLQLAIINNTVFPQHCPFFQVSSPCKLLQHVLIPDGMAEASTAFIWSSSRLACSRLARWCGTGKLPLLCSACPLHMANTAGWGDATPWRVLHVPGNSALLSICAWFHFFCRFVVFLCVCWVLFLFLLFCFPFTGSDVALAPVVTCFITSSFNNVSTDLNWSF